MLKSDKHRLYLLLFHEEFTYDKTHETMTSISETEKSWKSRRQAGRENPQNICYYVAFIDKEKKN